MGLMGQGVGIAHHLLQIEDLLSDVYIKMFNEQKVYMMPSAHSSFLFLKPKCIFIGHVLDQPIFMKLHNSSPGTSQAGQELALF